jgi:hypothetical protein
MEPKTGRYTRPSMPSSAHAAGSRRAVSGLRTGSWVSSNELCNPQSVLQRHQRYNIQADRSWSDCTTDQHSSIILISDFLKIIVRAKTMVRSTIVRGQWFLNGPFCLFYNQMVAQQKEWESFQQEAGFRTLLYHWSSSFTDENPSFSLGHWDNQSEKKRNPRS